MRRLTIGGLNFRLVLHAQQLDAVEIDLRDISGPEAVAADLDDVVVVFEVGLWPGRARPLPRVFDEGAAQREFEIAFQILVLRFGDLCCPPSRSAGRSSRLWSRSCR